MYNQINISNIEKLDSYLLIGFGSMYSRIIVVHGYTYILRKATLKIRSVDESIRTQPNIHALIVPFID